MTCNTNPTANEILNKLILIGKEYINSKNMI